MVLNNVNLVIHNKENIAILGENGADYKSDNCRKLFSVVSQKIFLFNGSVRKNITLYEDVQEKFLEQVISDSGLRDFVENFSLNYKVGDNGSMVSGGERQKIALARALIKNRSIIIFDEATSNIDLISEK